MTRIFQVDAFTDEAFKGNPAAICIMDEDQEDSWMQGVAKEMNLSETAFVSSRGDAKDGYNLRWFTPTVEVALCGHATLAAAHILWEEEGEASAELVFHTLSGELRVWRAGEVIWMDLPADRLEPVDAPDGLLEALGLMGRGEETVKFFKGRSDYLLHLDFAGGEDILSSLTPDFKALRLIPSRGFIVTAASALNGFDFVSRFFAPAFGIDEDPVTGSAHCTLGPYWAELLKDSDLTAYQASTRGGKVRLSVQADQEEERRVHIGGLAVTVFKGRLKE